MKKEWNYGLIDKATKECFFDSEKCARFSRDDLSFSSLWTLCNIFFIDGNGPFNLYPRERLHLQIEDGEIVSFSCEYQL